MGRSQGVTLSLTTKGLTWTLDCLCKLKPYTRFGEYSQDGDIAQPILIHGLLLEHTTYYSFWSTFYKFHNYFVSSKILWNLLVNCSITFAISNCWEKLWQWIQNHHQAWRAWVPTRSSALMGSPFLLDATTILLNLSLMSSRELVRARTAMISLATEISNWACWKEKDTTGKT